MTNYRRARVPGGTYFFTVVLAHRRGTALLIEHVNLLRQSMHTVRQHHPFDILAAVILPDHLHAIWRLPEGDDDFPTRWNLIKGGFSRAIKRRESISASRQSKRERGIWQRRYWEHLIRDEDDLRRHVEYIHYNPVKHGYVTRAIDWPHSSFRRYVAQGIYAADWGVGEDVVVLDFE